MGFPFPIGLISGAPGNILTRVDISIKVWGCTNTPCGGVEDGITGTGGSAVAYIAKPASVGSLQTVTIDLSSLNISWDDRYNYRLGFSSIYHLQDIKLYKNGVLTETQTGTVFTITNWYQHAGANLNPSSRVLSNVLCSSCVPYYK